MHSCCHTRSSVSSRKQSEYMTIAYMRTENINIIQIFRVGKCPQNQGVEAPNPKRRHEYRTNPVGAFLAHSSRPEQADRKRHSRIIPVFTSHPAESYPIPPCVPPKMRPLDIVFITIPARGHSRMS
jgi:hypothetical protein